MKKILFAVGFAISLNSNARPADIQKKYGLTETSVFFVDPNEKGTNTQTVDFLEAECNHIESINSDNTTSHLYTLTLTPCDRTEITGVIARPVAGDMVADNFDSIVNFNLNSKGSTQIIKADLYQVKPSTTLFVGQAEVDIQNFTGSTEDFKKMEKFQKQLASLQSKCEALKKTVITNAFSGDQIKAELVISSLVSLKNQPALEENKGKCDITSYAGKIIINKQ